MRQQGLYVHKTSSRGDTHRHRFNSFDEFFALQVLKDLVDLSQREVALEADVSAPDPCSTGRQVSNISRWLRHSQERTVRMELKSPTEDMQRAWLP